MTIKKARYQQIALDIAKEISAGNIKENVKIKGRSTLSSNYNTSPETIRKAISLLEANNIVEILPSSGIFVISKDKAQEFYELNKGNSKIITLKKNLDSLVEKRDHLNDKIKVVLKEISEISILLTKEYSNFLFLEGDAKELELIGYSISSTDIWNKIGGTIVAIKRDKLKIISPHPETIILENDIIFYVKDKGSYASNHED